MGRRFFFVSGALALLTLLVPGALGSPAGAASRSDGALTFALSGATNVGLNPTNSLYYDAYSSGTGALTALSDANAVSCWGFERGSGSLLAAGEYLGVNCNTANGSTTIDCDLTATRSEVTSVIAYGPCVVKRGTSTWNVFVPATVLQWVPTGTSLSSTTFVLSGTLPLSGL
jgi:hypothetical protein